jgi:hypothetical protein
MLAKPGWVPYTFLVVFRAPILVGLLPFSKMFHLLKCSFGARLNPDVCYFGDKDLNNYIQSILFQHKVKV